jgi:hypothetical protein
MRARAAALVALAALAAAPAAGGATRTIGYQGWTSQGREISFKLAKKGVSVMKLTVVVNCATGGAVAFTIRATDTLADPVRKGRFKTILEPSGSPKAVISGKFNRYGAGRGTITASGPGKSQEGQDFGNCATESPVRWTAAPR